uniref:Cysteine-rich receptor-like protein kinase 42 n=1 Tax=Kalanchoe fedtschenkoi TaxID=63787 RepID=A0A7N0TMU8_KALFE
MADLKWVLVLVLFVHLWVTAIADPRISEAELHCGTNRAASFGNFINTFVAEMDSLSKTINRTYFATTEIPVNASQPMYVLAQCHRDLSRNDCLLCFAASRTRLPRCLPALAGRLYLDGCFLRYDSYRFYNESVDPVLDKVNCTTSLSRASDGGVGDGEFARSVRSAIENVTARAEVNRSGFGVGEVNGVYALAQCWESLSSAGCRECLRNASRELQGCAPKSAEGRAMNAGCYLRYSTQKFYSDGDDLHSHSGVAAGVVVAIVLCTAAFLMFSCFTAYVGYARYIRHKEGRANSRFKLSSFSVNRSNLNYKYETLEKATDYFSLTRKLGQGGSGSVYKATLPDGKVVAVKRLIFNTKQWVDEFFNEVNLISGMQHKNLVKLLGCSIEGPESLLVYEYVENKSLDSFIFDKKQGEGLSWKQRLNIIIGTAEGIAHLHGGSETRIIHRDIKSSNVLLDHDMNAKIADFGLVRCFGADKSHLSTGIAGTLGYMAPEYLVRGQLTEKADVYSFGVLLIEIVCGRRNNVFVHGSGCLLQMVWKLYKSNRLSDCVDSNLENNFPEEEARDVILIGLLCTQASVGLRPSMADVVLMLTDKRIEIPEPKQPPFLNASALDPNISASYSGSSLVSTAPTRCGGFYTSSDISGIQSSEEPSRNEEMRQTRTV